MSLLITAISILALILCVLVICILVWFSLIPLDDLNDE
jgi:hypothetical protein